jgi:hypothetical protein
MILKTSFRRPGGLGHHLGRADTNERVEILEAHCVGVEPDLQAALELFASMGAAFGIERSLIHFVISPEKDLSYAETAACLEEIRKQYRLESDHPLIVLRHTKPGKTARPAHLHIVAPRKHPGSGATTSDSWSRRKDEKIARILEMALGHPLTSGRFNKSIADELEKQNPRLTQMLRTLDAPKGIAFNQKTLTQADTCKIDPNEFDRLVFQAWRRGGHDHASIRKVLDSAGLSLAQGDKVTMVLNNATGFSQPLRRLLRREAKRRDQKLDMKEADLRALFPSLPLLEQTRDKAMSRATRNLDKDIGREFTLAVADMVVLGDSKEARRLREEQEDCRRRFEDFPETKATLAARRDAIWAGYRLRNKIRQERVKRALAVARIRRSRIDLQSVFGLTITGAAVAGLSFGATICVGVAVTLVLARRKNAVLAVAHPAEIIRQVKADRAADLQATRAASQAFGKTASRSQGRNGRRGFERG